MIFLFLFLVFFSCSSHRPVEIPSDCQEAFSRLSELMSILSENDIRDMRTKEKIKDFFRSEEDEEKFIASFVYDLRNKNAYYGTFESYRLISVRKVDDSCVFELEMRPRKKYPIENIIIRKVIEFSRENGKYFIEPPEYVGRIKERKELPIPQIPQSY